VEGAGRALYRVANLADSNAASIPRFTHVLVLKVMGRLMN
jgi:hypothetical protein